MTKRLTLWRPREGVSANEALTCWRETHARLVEQVPGVRRYVQDHCVAGPDDAAPPYAGVGELWFDDIDAAKAALASREWQAVLADASTFMDVERITATWVEEHPIF